MPRPPTLNPDLIPSTCRILFTSAAASTVFISYGSVQWDYGAALFACGLLFTAAGQWTTMWVMRRLRGRASFIVFCMAAILGASAAALGVQAVGDTRHAFAEGAAWQWGSICGGAHA